MSYLAGLIHKRETAPEIGDWLAVLADSPLAADPHSDTGADIANLRRDYDRKTKLPQSLVEELARSRRARSTGMGRGPQGERFRPVSNRCWSAPWN